VVRFPRCDLSVSTSGCRPRSAFEGVLDIGLRLAGSGHDGSLIERQGYFETGTAHVRLQKRFSDSPITARRATGSDVERGPRVGVGLGVGVGIWLASLVYPRKRP